MRALALLSIFWICLLVGCGGGGGGSSQPAVTVSVSPSTAALGLGATQTFTASVTHTGNTAVNWGIVEGAAGGSINSSGVYTAPTVSGTFHVVATSQADPSKSATAVVTVTSPITITISPATVATSQGQSVTFTATVTGTANTAVTWRVQEGEPGGSITSTGVYTPIAVSGTFHVIATSQADTSKQAVATVVVQVGGAAGTIN